MSKQNWHVYIIKCLDGTLYTGITNNLPQRVEEHNRGKGCRYTRGRGPVKLVHSERFPNRSSALKRESQIKRWGREEKILLIKGKLIE